MSDKSKQNKNNGQARLSDGQVLVELMVAISVMVIGLLGIFTLLSQSLGLNRVAADQYIAANLAAEGVEVAKNILVHNVIERNPWNEGLERDGEFGVEYSSIVLDDNLSDELLKFDKDSGRYNYTAGDETNFRRVITINNLSEDEIRVNSRVEWRSRGGTSFSINLEDHFYNWRP